jgi:hypothetical protein
MADLGDVPPADTGFTLERYKPNACSGDGTAAVGTGFDDSGNYAPFYWSTTLGMRGLHAVLEEEFGVDLTGWTLLEANGISADGRKIVGGGLRAGNREGFVVTLDEPGECRPDCTGDGVLNINDFLCFQGAWRGRTAYGDFNGDGVWNINDFLAFQTEFKRGCP